MAKTYEELLEQAAIIRDETAAGKNTATRVGGTITDAVDYVKELQDTYAGIHAEAAAAKNEAAAAKTTAEQANRSATNAFDNARSALLTANSAQSTAAAANGAANEAKTESAQAVSTAQEAKEAAAAAQSAAETAQTAATAAKTTAEQAKTNAAAAFSKSTGAVLTANAAKATADGIAATAQEAKEAADDAQTTAADLRSKIKELGAFDTFAALFAQAARFDIVSNNAIALLHGTYKQAAGIYHGVLIFQQVEVNNDGGGTAMQYIYIEKRKYTRYIYFSQTEVTAVQGVQNDGARNLSLSGRGLQMKDMWGNNVGSGVTIPDNGNLREGSAGALSVPVVLSKTFGGTVTATLGAATSARAGVMTAEDKTRLDNLLTDIPWGGGRHMNVFIGKGDFHIYGERTDANDGLPILNAASGHTIDARLTVLDSSLTGGTGAKTDICVTQVLRLSNRTGGDGHVYVRTGQAATKAELTATNSTKWSTWEKLMGMFEKNVVADPSYLDTYTTNGMYSGLFMFEGSYKLHCGLDIPFGSTFLLVTVNGYAASAFNFTPQITQMMYILPTKTMNKLAEIYLRTAYWDAAAKAWVWGDWDKIVTASELSALEDRVTALEKK